MSNNFLGVNENSGTPIDNSVNGTFVYAGNYMASQKSMDRLPD